MGDMESQLAISYHQMSLKYSYCIVFSWVVGQESPLEIPRRPRLLLRQWVVLHKLTVGPHCLGQHPHSYSTWRSGADACVEASLLCLVSSVWEEKQKHQLSHKTLYLQFVLPTWYARAMVALVQALATMPHDPGVILGTHMVEGENQIRQVVPWLLHVCCGMCGYVCTQSN